MLTSVVIHGSLPTDSDWVDDNGTPLPYLPSSMDHTFEENATRLMLTSAPDGISFTFSAISPGENTIPLPVKYKSLNVIHADKAIFITFFFLSTFFQILLKISHARDR